MDLFVSNVESAAHVSLFVFLFHAFACMLLRSCSHHHIEYVCVLCMVGVFAPPTIPPNMCAISVFSLANFQIPNWIRKKNVYSSFASGRFEGHERRDETTNIEYERRSRGKPYHPSRVKKDLQILESINTSSKVLITSKWKFYLITIQYIFSMYGTTVLLHWTYW